MPQIREADLHSQGEMTISNPRHFHLWHGTKMKFLGSILKLGILPGGLDKDRNSVHLSSYHQKDTRCKAGMRFDAEILIKIDTIQALKTGSTFFEGGAGAILCPTRIDPSAIISAELSSSSAMLYERPVPAGEQDSDDEPEAATGSQRPYTPSSSSGTQVPAKATPKMQIEIKAPPPKMQIPAKAEPKVQIKAMPKPLSDQQAQMQKAQMPVKAPPATISGSTVPKSPPLRPKASSSSSSSGSAQPKAIGPSGIVAPYDWLAGIGEDEEIKEEFKDEIKDEVKDEIKMEMKDEPTEVEESSKPEELIPKAAKFLPPEMRVDLEADSDVEESIGNLLSGGESSGAQAPADATSASEQADSGAQVPADDTAPTDSWVFDYTNVEFGDEEAEAVVRKFRNEYGVELDWVKRSRGRRTAAAQMVKRLRQYDKTARKPKHGFTGYEDRFEKDPVFRARMLQYGYGPDFRHIVETIYAPQKGPATGGGNRARGRGKGQGNKRSYEESSSSSSWRAGAWTAAAAWASGWRGASGYDIVLYDPDSRALVSQESPPSELAVYMDFIATPYFKMILFMIMALFFIIFVMYYIVRVRRPALRLSAITARWVKLLTHAWRLRFRMSLWAFLGQFLDGYDTAFSFHLRTVYLPPSGIPPKKPKSLKEQEDKKK
jgi:hypothetical protein